jgi:hypothetical protein
MNQGFRKLIEEECNVESDEYQRLSYVSCLASHGFVPYVSFSCDINTLSWKTQTWHLRFLLLFKVTNIMTSVSEGVVKCYSD